MKTKLPPPISGMVRVSYGGIANMLFIKNYDGVRPPYISSTPYDRYIVSFHVITFTYVMDFGRN